MQIGLIVYAVGWGGVLVTFAMLVPLAMSLYLGDAILARNFVIGFLVTAFVSVGLILAAGNAPRLRAREQDLFTAMVLYWIVLPLPACIPFVGDAQVQGLVAAYFEAVSGLTTSGASVFAQPENASAPIIIWRAILNWLGGLWTLVFAVAVLAPSAIGGVGLYASPYLQVEEHATLPVRLRKPFLVILPVYVIVTLIGFLFIRMGGADGLASVALSLSAISTGGFSPVGGALSAHYSEVTLLAISALSIAGAISLPVLIALLRADFVTVEQDVELRVFFALTLIWYAVSLLVLEGGIATVFYQTISLASTASFVFMPSEVASNWPVVWMILPVVLGGMSLSTAGGSKVIRAVVLFKDLSNELRRLPYPSSVQPTKLGIRDLSERDRDAVWSYFAVLILTIAVALIVAGLFGVPLDDGWALVLTSLTNSNGALGLIDSPHHPMAMGAGGQIFICLLMIAGRIELLVLLVLLNPSYWRLAR